MRFLKAEGVKLVAIQAENITDGNLTLILGMIWTIIQQYQISDISEEELTAKEALLLWCKKKTKGYEGVDPPGLKNFHTSWRDGKALCALIHRHRPDLLDYSKCKDKTDAENVEWAFQVAEDKLNIPRLLDVEDLADTAKPDERSVITYVVQYYHVFAASQKGEVAGRRVGKLVDLTRAINRLKNDYNTRADVLRSWVNDKIQWLDDRSLGETEEEIAAKLAEYNQYKKEEKPEKAGEKSALEGLYNSIQVKLSSNNRPPFEADTGLSPPELNDLWAKLAEAERNREQALRGARSRERELNLLNTRLDDKANRLGKWIDKSDAYLGREENVDNVTAANSKLKELEAWNGEYADTKPRVAELQALSKGIKDLNGPTADAAGKRVDELSTRFDGLAPKGDAKQKALNEALAREQAKDAARQAWAKGAKEYVQYATEAADTVNGDRYFGDSLETVDADKARVDKDSSDTTATNGTKKGEADQLWAKLQELGVTDNKYSPLTADDVNKASQGVDTALKARDAAWDEAQKREAAKEAKRKEFADAADKFVKSVDARRAELDALQGEPTQLSQTLGKTYDDGKPENEQLKQLAKLQEESAALGITSNKHTPYNMAALRSKSSALERFVKNKQSALAEEAELKHDYEERAKALTAWIASTQPKIEDQSVANTLDDARSKLADFQAYRTTERAEKASAKSALTSLEQTIQTLLQNNNRPAYEPPAALSQATIDEQWSALESAETAKGEFLRSYLARQEELDVLLKRFNADANDLESWLGEKKAYLAEEPQIDTLYKAQYARVVHQSYDEEASNRKARFDAASTLAKQIADLEYGDADAITGKAGELQAAYDALAEPAAAKSKAIADALATEQAKEDARIAYASKAKNLARWAAVAQQNIADRTFGFTLDAVTKHGEKLDASDADYKQQADKKRAQVAAATAKLEELGVTDNSHTKLTPANADASKAAVLKALEARRAAYDAELAQQQRWDASRKAFADDAEQFVAWLGEQRSQVAATSGSPDERADAIRAIHQDGKPGAEKLDALGKQADAMSADGVVGNDYTGYTVPLLQERNETYNQFVATALQNVENDRLFDEQTAKLQEEQAAADKREQEQFEFQKRATVLLNYLDNAGAFLTEPVSATSVEEVSESKKELDSFKKELASREPEYGALKALAPSVKDGALIDDLNAKWDETQQLVSKREAALGDESGKQESNEALRKQFADAAQKFQDWLNGQSAKLAGTSGDLQAQQKSLEALVTENAGGDEQLAGVTDIAQQLDEAGVTDNPHTTLSAGQLKSEYESLLDATTAKQKLVGQEIAKKSDSGVSPEQINEFREVFNHFDKNKDATLQNFELKACLNSLGDDPSEDELNALFTKYAGGADKISFDQFTTLMTDRAKDSDTADSILESFKVIAGDKDFVTQSDLAAVMQPDQVEYLVANMPKSDLEDGAFDYKKWVQIAYQ